MIEEYKKRIYEQWAENRPKTSPYPTKETINKQFLSYKKVIEDLIPKDKNKKILDLGCGYGFFLDTLKKMGYKDIQGVEMTKNFIDIATKVFELSSITHEKIDTYLDQNQKFDVITAFDVMEHFKKEELMGILKKIYHSLNEGGIFIFRSPNAESMSGNYIMNSDITHEIMFTRLLIEEIFDLTGFKSSRSFPSFVNSNTVIRFCQKIIAKIFGLDNKFMFSSNIIGIGIK